MKPGAAEPSAGSVAATMSEATTTATAPAPSTAGAAPVLTAPGPAIPAQPRAVERFLALVEAQLAAGSLGKIVLARHRGGEPGLERVVLRPLLLRGEPVLSATTRYATRDTVKNLPLAEALGWLRSTIDGGSFGHAHLFAADGEAQLLLSKKGTATLRQAWRRPATAMADRPAAATDEADAAHGAPGADRADAATATARASGTAGTVAMSGAAAPEAADRGVEADPHGAAGVVQPTPATAPAHDRAKHRHVDLAAPFLVALGVTDASHRLIPAMARKWKQIDKFVEIFEHALAASPLDSATTVRVADYGAGKGYLTFAVHDHLRRRAGVVPAVTGVEWRQDMVELGNAAAARLGLDGLAFVQGDVRTHAPGALDVMIALHACDTATDHAIHRGVRAGASIIMTAPCCHKELRPQLLVPTPLRPLLRHGIHLGQQAEMLTDGLRALLLEAEGYETQVFEFVSLEHTSKNKMILAVKRGGHAAARCGSARAGAGADCRTDGVLRGARAGAGRAAARRQAVSNERRERSAIR